MRRLEFSNFQNCGQEAFNSESSQGQCEISEVARFLIALALAANTSRALSKKSQQLVRIDVDGGSNIFREWQLVESFADEAAQAHDGLASDQNVKAKLAL